MGILTNLRARIAYKREFKRSIAEQKLNIDKKVLDNCIDIAMTMNRIFYLANKGRALNVNVESQNYINSFINANVAALVKTLSTAQKADNSYIG